MNEKEPKFYVKQHGDVLTAKSNADTLTLNLNIKELLALQEKYTALECECIRFADYVMNLTHNRDTKALHFDNEYLNMAGYMLFKSFGRIPNPDSEEIIKEFKK